MLSSGIESAGRGLACARTRRDRGLFAPHGRIVSALCGGLFGICLASHLLGAQSVRLRDVVKELDVSVPAAAFGGFGTPLPAVVGARAVGDSGYLVVNGVGGAVLRVTKAGRVEPSARIATADLALVSWAAWCDAKRMLAWDFSNLTYWELSADGRGAQRTMAHGWTGAATPSLHACEGSSIAMIASPRQPQLPVGATVPYFSRESVEASLFVRGATLPLSRAPVLGYETAILRTGSRSPRPLGRSTLVAVSAGSMYLWDTESGWLSRVSPGGAPKRLALIQGERGHPNVAEIEEAVRELSRFAWRSDQRDAIAKGVSHVSPPAERVAGVALFSGEPGQLWAQTGALGSATTILTKLDEDGRSLEAWRIPPYTLALGVHGPRLLARCRLPNAVEHFCVFVLSR